MENNIKAYEKEIAIAQMQEFKEFDLDGEKFRFELKELEGFVDNGVFQDYQQKRAVIENRYRDEVNGILEK